MNIKNIVINGGGPIIFNAYGALKQANLSGIWSYDSVESFYGTSAGAILAIILALQYSWEDLDDFIIKRPWQQVWKFNLLNVYEYYSNKGIFGKEMFNDFLGPLFKGKDLEVSISFKEFHELFKKNLYIYAVNLASLELVEFSHVSHPDMPILDAVRASSALPILFQPVKYGGNLYTDGGFLMNYPLVKCTADPKTILGVRNAYITSSPNEVNGLFEYLSYILNKVIDQLQFSCTFEIPYELKINTDFIDYSVIHSLANSASERQTLINRGMEDALVSIKDFTPPLQTPPSFSP
jgi:predicted acylesterase/phospholipase RssA